MSTQEGGPQLNNKNLLFYFDAANPKSYDKTSSYGYSMVLGTTASLLNYVTADDADECTWNDVSYSGDINVDMAFDHKEVIKTTIKKMRRYKL